MARNSVGFLFSSKDRTELTRRSLASIDSQGGFDLIWVDGSSTSEGQSLPAETRLRNCRLREVHPNVRGGPDRAIRYGLKRLLELGYDHCGMIENDVEFDPQWFSALMGLFDQAAGDGFTVGAASVRTFESRILFHQTNYALLWNLGAGMALLTREAARILLSTYRTIRAREISRFYERLCGDNLKDRWELWLDQPDRTLGCDWRFALQLHEAGLACVGTVPSHAVNIDDDCARTFRTRYAGEVVAPSPVERERLSLLRDRLAARRNGAVPPQLRRPHHLLLSRLYRARHGLP